MYKKIKVNINEMLNKCVHLGHRIKSTNYYMKPYIFRMNNEINIINLEKTKNMLEKSLKIIYDFISIGKIILIICTKKRSRKIIEMASKSINMPYINQRWLGGTLTNFDSLKKSINKMNYIKELIKNKSLKFKKKILAKYKRKHKKLKKFLGGMKNIKKLPDLIFIIDSNHHKASILEAKKVKIPTICIVDTNSSPLNIDYFIPGNDDSIKSIFFYLKMITNTVLESKKNLK